MTVPFEPWDAIYASATPGRVSVWKDGPTPFVIQRLPLLRQRGVRQVLDAGCGDGRNLAALAEAGFTVTGMDGSPLACTMARRSVARYPSARVICLPLEDLNLYEAFDAIVCDFVMVHLREQKRVLVSFDRALRPGGLLLIEFLSTEDPACGRGEALGNNAYIHQGVYHRFVTESEVDELLGNLTVVQREKVSHWDPGHVSHYPRSEPHQHVSVYALCEKCT